MVRRLILGTETQRRNHFLILLDMISVSCYNRQAALCGLIKCAETRRLPERDLYERERPMTAIFETGGKQYRVNEGDIIYVEKLDAQDGGDLSFNTVIAVLENDKIKTGKPYLADVKVVATVVKSGKAKKVIVYKMKPKKNYRKKQGHRQPYTKLQIKSIVLPA